MLKELKTAKWYWFIPLLSIYHLMSMSKWTLSGKTPNSRLDRHLITNLNIVFPNLFIIVLIISLFSK